MSQTKQEFIDKYKEIAIQQQLKYGIPASITLSQAILESSYGTSRQAKECNNFFGVKRGESWKGDTKDYLDDHDKPEPFRKYSNPEQSFEDHSKILTVNNGQVAQKCKKISATNYQGWAHAIAYSGYCNLKGSATYEKKLLGEISDYNLHSIDLEAENRRKNGEVAKQVDTRHVLQPMSGNFAMPIDFSKDIEVSSEFGMRKHPTKGKMMHHNGIDISTKGQHLPVFATEDKGKVVKVGYQEKGAGNYVTVEYNRPDGNKFQTTYMHLSEVAVKENEIVNAKQKLGVTGSTGGSILVYTYTSRFVSLMENRSRQFPRSTILQSCSFVPASHVLWIKAVRIILPKPKVIWSSDKVLLRRAISWQTRQTPMTLPSGWQS